MDPDKKLPTYLAQFLASSELISAIERIGRKFTLHIDQIGELDAEVRDVLRGHATSATFVTNVSRRLEIDKKLAEEIARDINVEIFQAIKAKMQAGTIPRESTPVQYTQTSNSTSEANSVVGASNNSIAELRNVAALESVGDMQIETEKPAPQTFRDGNMDREALKKSVNAAGGIEIRDENNSFYHEAPPAPDNLPGAVPIEDEPRSKSGVPPLASVPKYGSDPYHEPVE